jgi:hypothetical protein
MSHKEIAFADPKDVDIIVPGSPDDILNIMRGYPLDWERAGNAPYFAPGNGLLIGLAAERGTVYPDYGSKDTAKWPALYIEGDDITKASFGRADNARAQKALAATSAGPMLVSQGGILDIPARIREGGYSGFTADGKRPQRAVGITASGDLADGVWESADLYEVAEDMIEKAGCIEVMKWDGGRSTAIAEFDHKTGKPVLAWGWASRDLPAVIAFRKVKHVWRPSDSDILPHVDIDLNFNRNITTNFKLREFACKHCGAVNVSPQFAQLVARLQMLRSKVGKPVNVTSGYRCAIHDAAVGTSSNPGRGPHTTGTAADIWWDGASVDEMAAEAKEVGFTGVGRYYGQGFIHVDLREKPSYFIG